MKIPFIDVKKQNLELRKKLLKRADRIISDSSFILGEDVRGFEKEFSLFCNSRFACGVNSGTDALFLALLSLGIGSGDEVVCPAYTYIATALSVSYTGAKPVFADIDERTFNITAEELEKRITKKTKAVIVVHLYGLAADMPAIMRVAKKNKIKVIEDAAQAHGAAIVTGKGVWKNVGTFGDIGCFSFYPTKNLGACGDAGVVVTDNKKIYEKLLMLRDQGRRGRNRYLHHIRGYNARLDSLQAAFLSEKLKMLKKWNEQRRQAAHLYSSLLADVKGVTVPFEPSGSRHVFHIYPLLVGNRDKAQRLMQDKGISTGIVYHCPLHLQKAYKDLGHKRGDFPAAERVARSILCLPMYPHLTKAQAVFVAGSLKKILE